MQPAGQSIDGGAAAEQADNATFKLVSDELVPVTSSRWRPPPCRGLPALGSSAAQW